MTCSYHDHKNSKRLGSVACNGSALFTAHDRRGCRPVCGAHALWLSTRSIALGHGTSCPMKTPTRK